MRNEREDAVERTLKALGGVAAPDGLEARVLAGVERHAAVGPGVEFHWRDVVAGSALAGVWWRGALSGAVAVALVLGAAMLVQHGLARQRDGSELAKGAETVRQPLRVSGIVGGSSDHSAANGSGKPCASGATRVLTAHADSPLHLPKIRLAANAGPEKPFAEEPLTKEEQELVRLTRKVDPRELSTLNPEVREKQEADDVAQFEKFFYQPPVKITTERDDD